MHEILLIIHFIGLAMGLGTSFAFMFLGIASAKMEKSEATKFTLSTFALAKMGHIGMTLLVVSGLFLITPYWQTLLSTPLLIVKLCLVILLGGLLGMIAKTVKNAQIGNPEIHFKKLMTLGRIAMVTSLTIVVLAVFIFH